MVNAIPETLEARVSAAVPATVTVILSRATGMEYLYELAPADARRLAEELIAAADLAEASGTVCLSDFGES